MSRESPHELPVRSPNSVHSVSVTPPGQDPRRPVFGQRTLYDNLWVRPGEVDVEPPDGKRFEHFAVRLHRVVLALFLGAEGTEVQMLRCHRCR